MWPGSQGVEDPSYNLHPVPSQCLPMPKFAYGAPMIHGERVSVFRVLGLALAPFDSVLRTQCITGGNSAYQRPRDWGVPQSNTFCLSGEKEEIYNA